MLGYLRLLFLQVSEAFLQTNQAVSCYEAA